jgi:outer membrane protein OmpA-like peptidoglycan-associated protein
MHFQVKKTIAHVTVLSALIPLAACTGGQAVRKAEPASTQVAALRDPDLAPKHGEYSYDTVQDHVVRTTVTGECVQTIYWTQDGATPECHPSLYGRTAPRAAAPAAPPAAVETVTETVEYEAMEYTEAPDYEAAPYEEPPAATAAAEPPMEDFYAPGDSADLVPVPPPSGDEAADDRISEPTMYYEEEETVAADDGITGRQEYFEEEVIETEEGITGRREYYEEEEEIVRDDGIVNRSEYYEEEEVVQDDGIVSESQYYEEDEEVVEDDGIVARTETYEEEEVRTPDEGIVGHSQFSEEEEVVEQEETIVSRTETYEEEGKQPEDLISEPTAVEEEEEEMVAAVEEEAAPAVAAAEQEQEAAPAVAAAEQEQEAAPAVAAAEPEPAPEPTPVVLPMTITLEAEPWFDFDRYTIRSDGRDKLDKLVSDLSSVEFDEIVVVGHADPIGTPEYNQALSERRARAVKNYLVSKGVEGVRIKDEGRGEYDLPFDPALCKSLKKQKLIDCLQPDRVVEVTVTGTKPR